MKQCLECEKPFEAKRESAKFCSVNCRVKWNRKNGNKTPVKPIQVQVLYNAMMDMVSNFKFTPTTPSSYDAPKIPIVNDEYGQFSPPKPLKRRSYESYREGKRECETAEQWEELRVEIDADMFLTKKEKDLLKTTNL
jgi:hypothetical protein